MARRPRAARARPARLRGLSFNLVEGEGTGDVDGVSELWFDSQAAFEAAYASEHGRAVAADRWPTARRERLLVAEHALRVPGA